MSQPEKLQELERLKAEVQKLEREVAEEVQPTQWPPQGYYATYHALAGFVLGILGASTSLLFNVVGSILVGQHPLELIRIYLTFPLGEQALQIEDGIALVAGCCLYLGTGMVLGVPFQLLMSRFGEDSFLRRFFFAGILGIVIWIFNYYCILIWLQPLLFGDAWIVEMIPEWVAALTHLVFAWTMVLTYRLGQFIPYQTSDG